MKIVAYLDNDQLNKPYTNGAKVYAVGEGESSPATREQLMEKYPSVFNEEVGLLEGEYHIRLISKQSRYNMLRYVKARLTILLKLSQHLLRLLFVISFFPHKSGEYFTGFLTNHCQ